MSSRTTRDLQLLHQMEIFLDKIHCISISSVPSLTRSTLSGSGTYLLSRRLHFVIGSSANSLYTCGTVCPGMPQDNSGSWRSDQSSLLEGNNFYFDGRELSSDS